MKNKKMWIAIAIALGVVLLIWTQIPKPAEAACTGCGEGGHGACIEVPGHTHDDDQDHAHEDGVWLDHKHEKK